MRFDLCFYDSIDICGSSIYMYAVRFIFVRFNLFFAVLKILSETERHTLDWTLPKQFLPSPPYPFLQVQL